MISIAIDGPAGAGKSTVSKAAAKELGYMYVDTGAMYRAVGLNAIRRGVDLGSPEEIAASISNITLGFSFGNDGQRVILNGEDVSEEIRLPQVSTAASKVSAVPQVRAWLLDTQRNLALENNVLMDGRDIGTVVLPNAQVKIFLTASAECRARRRYNELVEKGVDADYEQVLADINDRDYADSHRAAAPLKAADDATVIDTSSLDLEQSIEAVVSFVRDRLNEIKGA